VLDEHHPELSTEQRADFVAEPDRLLPDVGGLKATDRPKNILADHEVRASEL